ncbi:hypothetical protein ACVXHB_13405 [Escherichia coli]
MPANPIKLLLSSGKIRVIGSTTYQEFSNIFEKDRAPRVASRKLTSPNVDQRNCSNHQWPKPKYEAHHDVRYTAKRCVRGRAGGEIH